MSVISAVTYCRHRPEGRVRSERRTSASTTTGTLSLAIPTYLTRVAIAYPCVLSSQNPASQTSGTPPPVGIDSQSAQTSPASRPPRRKKQNFRHTPSSSGTSPRPLTPQSCSPAKNSRLRHCPPLLSMELCRRESYSLKVCVGKHAGMASKRSRQMSREDSAAHARCSGWSSRSLIDRIAMAMPKSFSSWNGPLTSGSGVLEKKKR